MLQTAAKHHIIPNRDYYITIIFCHDNVNGTFQKILGVTSGNKDFRIIIQKSSLSGKLGSEAPAILKTLPSNTYLLAVKGKCIFFGFSSVNTGAGQVPLKYAQNDVSEHFKH